MEQTVIGIFNSASKAQDAKEQLLNNGFSDSEIDIASGNLSDYNSKVKLKDTDDEHEHESGIARFFRNLFGSDDDKTERYTRVAERGTIVTVHAQSKDEAERAADLLDDYGAVDVDENYKYYTSTETDNNSSWGVETGATIGAGNGLGTATPMGDTYIETDQTTSGIVRDRNIDETRFNRNEDSNIIADDRDNSRGFVDSNNRREENRGLFDKDKKRENDDSHFVIDNDQDLNPEGRVIPVIEENIHVGKREVETGGVRIRSRIIEKPVEENLRLRQEHIRVERNPVDREATAEDLDNFKEETIELREISEEPFVEKRARVVEEVSLNKDVDHREENISDTVRNTTVDVEELEGEKRRRNL